MKRLPLWLAVIATISLSTSTLASGLEYADPPPDTQRGEYRPRPTPAPTLEPTQGNIVTDSTGQAAQSSWSTHVSSEERQEAPVHFGGGGDDASSSPYMLSGRVEWNQGEWSDCEPSTTDDYCGSVVDGTKTRSVWCEIDRIDAGIDSSIGNSLCTIPVAGAKPATTAACAATLVTDCNPAPSIVAISATPGRDLLADGNERFTITATLKEPNGTRVPNRPITWTTTKGTLNTTTTTTNSNGEASVTLRSSTIGDARVTASSFDSSRSTTVTFVTTIPDLVSLSASPASGVSANNSDTSTLTATVKYVNGQPAPSVRVNFSTNRGTLSRSWQNTDSNGRARITLRSGSAGTAKVTASSSGDTRSTNVGFSGPSLVGLSASPSSNVTANGSSSSRIRATVRYPNGQSAPNSSVSFSTTRGWLNRTTATTNSSGYADVYLRSNSAGTAKVTARSGNSRSTNVYFKTASETKYDSNHMLDLQRGVCTHDNYHGRDRYDQFNRSTLIWNGVVIKSSNRNDPYPLDESVVVGGYRYSWDLSSPRYYREAMIPCPEPTQVWLEKYAVTRTPL